MGASTEIAWTDSTFNPWMGCTNVSPACDNCYAEVALKGRFKALGVHWGPHAERVRTKSTWKNPVIWSRSAQKAGTRTKVFAASWADVFDNQVPQEWRRDLFQLIAETPHLDWQLLTKRPQNISKMLPDNWSVARYPHVWLGTTVENVTETRRIAHLRAVPAAVRFLSCEPLLEAIEPDLDGIDWVICGGESGPGARMMDPAWARRLRDQCAERRVAFFMKQMTAKKPIPDDLLVRQFPVSELVAA